MQKYWIAVASREHVKVSVEGGFAQVCHGKGSPLKRMAPDDWIIYYSPVEMFGGNASCKKFTAIGQITHNDPYEYVMNKEFIPWRRDVSFFNCQEVPIIPLINDLDFIKNKKNWGFPFRRGCFEIPKHDFIVIASKMGISVK